MLDDLDRMMTQEKSIDWKKINYEVLLLSIFWHDVWKSLKQPTNKRKMIYQNFWDGMGSMRVFGKRAKLFSIDKPTVREVKYAIRKHSGIQFLPKTTIESKILRDLDRLEEWSVNRLFEGLSLMEQSQYLTPKLVKVAKFYFEHWMMRHSRKHMYFPWTDKEIVIRRKIFISQAKDLLVSFAKKFLTPQPTTSSFFADKN